MFGFRYLARRNGPRCQRSKLTGIPRKQGFVPILHAWTAAQPQCFGSELPWITRQGCCRFCCFSPPSIAAGAIGMSPISQTPPVSVSPPSRSRTCGASGPSLKAAPNQPRAETQSFQAVGEKRKKREKECVCRVLAGGQSLPNEDAGFCSLGRRAVAPASVFIGLGYLVARKAACASRLLSLDAVS